MPVPLGPTRPIRSPKWTSSENGRNRSPTETPSSRTTRRAESPPRSRGVDPLVGHRRRRRTSGDELLPAGLGGIGLRRVLEVHGRPLLHDLHVPEQPAFLVVPAVERVTKTLLALLPSLRVGRIGPTVHPRPTALDRDHLGDGPLEQRAVVADHQDGRLAGRELRFQPRPGRDVEVVVGLVEEQHVGPGVEQHVEQQPLAFAAGELADPASRDVVDR